MIHLLHLHTYTRGVGLVAVLVGGAGLLASRGARPLAKNVIKGALTASETARRWATTAVEEAQDLYEETRAELNATADGATAAAASTDQQHTDAER